MAGHQEAANKKKKATHDQQQRIIACYCRTARATEAATFQANNKTIENANENNLKLKFNFVHPSLTESNRIESNRIESTPPQTT